MAVNKVFTGVIRSPKMAVFPLKFVSVAVNASVVEPSVNVLVNTEMVVSSLGAIK